MNRLILDASPLLYLPSDLIMVIRSEGDSLLYYGGLYKPIK
jgi:hypothetical protein